MMNAKDRYNRYCKTCSRCAYSSKGIEPKLVWCDKIESAWDEKECYSDFMGRIINGEFSPDAFAVPNNCPYRLEMLIE